jgi:hypothetical protein
VGIVSGIGKRAAKISRKVKRKAEKALRPKYEQHDIEYTTTGEKGKTPAIYRGRDRGLEPISSRQRVVQNIKSKEGAVKRGKGRLEGGAIGTGIGLGLGTVAGGATVAALSGDKDKKKTGGAKASTRKKVTVKKKPSDSKSNGRVNPSDYPIYQKDTKSGKAFRKAFKEAVKAGKKTFKFEGRVYNTKKKAKKKRTK